MNWLKSILTEGEGNISVGSVLLLLFGVVFVTCVAYAQYMKVALVVTPAEAGIYCGVLYGLKKIPAIWIKEKNGTNAPAA